MIKSKLYNFLNQYLAEYLYGFNEDQLQVALLQGHVDFNSANLKPQRVNQDLMKFNLPFRLKAGILTGLKLNFSLMKWKSNTIEVNIDECLIVLGAVIRLNPEGERTETVESEENQHSNNHQLVEEM